ncbi:uncharacterized protein [Aegilops tauschii subsp. strangulata]|uniref:uncharacterized protein isoform X1 n=1 Tax=Aegilops tauschii subsp. strangulata TaxID=200361 RepID=UPI00098A3380|nr:uncharacterized protein LOC109747933 isoform X2 [Aegilops tauschii subsp. strangulata]XP_044331475.1 uncharacterized protein LOC123052392 isoform X2 [Triticum aestivum]
MDLSLGEIQQRRPPEKRSSRTQTIIAILGLFMFWIGAATQVGRGMKTIKYCGRLPPTDSSSLQPPPTILQLLPPQAKSTYNNKDIPLAAEASKDHSNVAYIVTPLGLHELMVDYKVWRPALSVHSRVPLFCCSSKRKMPEPRRECVCFPLGEHGLMKGG